MSRFFFLISILIYLLLRWGIQTGPQSAYVFFSQGSYLYFFIILSILSKLCTVPAVLWLLLSDVYIAKFINRFAIFLYFTVSFIPATDFYAIHIYFPFYLSTCRIVN